MMDELQRLDNEALNYLLNDKKGRWFLMRLLDRARVNVPTFHRSAVIAAYNEGRRAIGLEYLAMLTTDVNHITKKQQAEREYADTIARLEGGKKHV